MMTPVSGIPLLSSLGPDGQKKENHGKIFVCRGYGYGIFREILICFEPGTFIHTTELPYFYH